MNGNAKAWVAALRSGYYEQGHGTLQTDDGKRFCCLGVACEMYVKAGGGFAIGDAPDIANTSDIRRRYGNKLYTLPPEVKEYMGMNTEGGQFKDEEGQTTTLTEMNDNGSSFDVIADLIESEPEGLFAKPEFTAMKAAKMRDILGEAVDAGALNIDPNFHKYYDIWTNTYSPLGYLLSFAGVHDGPLIALGSTYITQPTLWQFAEVIMDMYGLTDLDQLEFIQMEWDKERDTGNLLRFPAMLVSGLVW